MATGTLQIERARVLYERGVAAQHGGRLHEAIGLLEQAVTLDPTLFRARHLLGLCHEERGEFGSAIAHYRQALRINPTHARSLANLIALPSFESEPALLEHAQRLLAEPALEPVARAKLHHALGKHYDRNGDYDTAFDHFTRSNSAQRTMLPPFNRLALAAAVDGMIATFDTPMFEALRDAGEISQRPVFVVGMPRSGTTLVEQILASHPEAFGAGELTAMTDIAKELNAMRGRGIALDRETAGTLAQAYLARIDTLAPQAASRVVDKLPFNFAHLGLIAVLFPQASIVHCTRDVLDVGLSCYIETFRKISWTMDLEDLGFYIAQKERLMAHWRRVLPVPIHDLDYAALISNQERETRALLQHCGLPWHQGCLDYFRTERHVNTPSRWQVRQPLYGSSQGRWRRYRRHLDPLLAMLPAGLRTDR